MSDAVEYLESAYVISKNLLNGDLIEFIISIFNEKLASCDISIIYCAISSNNKWNLLNSVLLTHVLFVL